MNSKNTAPITLGKARASSPSHYRTSSNSAHHSQIPSDPHRNLAHSYYLPPNQSENISILTSTTFQPIRHSPQKLILGQQSLNQQSNSLQQTPTKMIVLTSPTKSNLFRKQHENNNNQSQSKIIQASSTQESLLLKVKILESRVKELHQEKQNMFAGLSEENKKLKLENVYLNQMMKKAMSSHQTLLANTNQPLIGSSNSIDVEIQLSEEIERSLNLRQNLDHLVVEKQELSRQIEELIQANQQTILFRSNILSGLGLPQSSDEEVFAKISDLCSQSAHLVEEKRVREENWSLLINQKEKQLLELQENIYTLEVQQQENKDQSNLQIQEILKLQGEINEMKTQQKRGATKEECQKCKEQLRTIFRLNNQLSKK